MPKRKEIILARVFFSDSPESKVRPAIVLSDDTYHSTGFILVSAITTASDGYCAPISEKDANCQLDKNSGARFDGIIKLHEKQAIRSIGRVSAGFHNGLVEKIVGTIAK
ncbi:hypothetical protein GF412_02870 [Candidatus Micrarchaeota archaeon]|nr:hypothetical protein [Candidatus Micrarchaeota archaeon]MBD3417896.1 hypothetical protein [Candidatus Micrarchaeota archaeon]